MYLRAFRGLALGIFAVLLPAACFAQMATLTGVIRDKSGAPIPGVTIELANTATDQTRSQITETSGSYTFTSLPPGEYTLKLQATGFSRVTMSGINLQVDQVARQDVTLELASVSQELNVIAAAPIMQTEEASVGEVIDSRQVVDLPLNGRSFKQLALLLPGTVPDTATTTQAFGFNIPRGNFQSNGIYSIAYSYRIDGVENFHKLLGINTLDLSIDAIQEFKIEQNNFSIDSGRGTTVTSIVTRSGSNAIHGSVFEFFRNDILDANNFFDRPESGGKGSFRMNQFGAALGGPAIRNKLFYFADFEALRSLKGQTQFANFPTPAQLAGNLSGMGTILDTTCGCPFPNDQIPASRISQYAHAANQYWPVPNAPGILPGSDDVADLKQKNKFTQETLRLDWNASANDQVFARGTSDSSRFNRPEIQPLTDLNTTYHTSNLSVRWDRTINPSTVNDLLFGYNFGNYRLEVPTTSSDATKAFGLQNLSIQPQWYGIPWTSITGFARQGPNSWEPWYEPEHTFQWTDSFTMVRGSHTIKTGAEVLRMENLSTEPFANRGFINFTGVVTGNALADYLLGDVGFANGGQGDPGRDSLRYTVTAYVGDDWKVRPNLTLNLGVRWDGATMPTSKNNRMAIFDPDLSKFPGDALGAYRQAGVGGEGSSIINSDLATFAPRIGFAYRPLGSHRVVLRGGFGIFYGIGFVGQEEQFLTVNLPFFFLSTPASQGPQSIVHTTDLFPAPPPLYPNPDAKFVAEGQGMYTIPQNIKFPRSNQWNFAVQTLLTPTLSLDTAYVGDSSHHLQDRWNINQGALPGAAEVASGNFSPLSTREAYSNLGVITSSPYWGNSNYNALQVKLEKRFSSGLSFLGSYAWGKAIDDVDIVAVESGEYFYDRQLEKGRGSSDVRQMFTLSYSYELPFGPGRQFLNNAGAVGRIFGGWSVNGISTFHTGLPLTISDGADTTQTNSSGPRPNRICDGNLRSGQRTVDEWFNTACFTAPIPGTLGDAGRRIISAPGINNWDISVFKQFTLGENRILTFRTEFFNAFNHPQFDPPGLTFGTPGFGVITSAEPPREIQFALKLNF